MGKAGQRDAAEKTTHQQVRIDLNAKQAITFFADDLGSNLSLECSADAKSLSVRQINFTHPVSGEKTARTKKAARLGGGFFRLNN
jgi:hypothetical protein